jgi:hypothetical protein
MTAAPQQSSGVEVTQADREAAADLVMPNGRWPGFPADFRVGRADANELTQAFARHRLRATVEGRMEIIARGCIHTAKASERTTERADIAAWQEAQSEFFNGTILEIVSEYAEWRDAQETLTAHAKALHDAGPLIMTAEEFNRICAKINARAKCREIMG